MFEMTDLRGRCVAKGKGRKKGRESVNAWIKEGRKRKNLRDRSNTPSFPGNKFLVTALTGALECRLVFKKLYIIAIVVVLE